MGTLSISHLQLEGGLDLRRLWHYQWSCSNSPRMSQTPYLEGVGTRTPEKRKVQSHPSPLLSIPTLSPKLTNECKPNVNFGYGFVSVIQSKLVHLLTLKCELIPIQKSQCREFY